MNPNCRLHFYLLLFLVSGISHSVFSQNKSLGIGVDPPNPNAALHVESPTNNQGIIIPRLTTAQRTAMALAAADKGLTVYDTDLNSQITWDGVVWSSSSKLIYPYADNFTSTTGTADLFKLSYDNAESKRIVRIENNNATNGSSSLSVLNQGTGLAGFFQINNPVAGTSAVYGTTNSDLGGGPTAPVGVFGVSTGIGSLGGAFRVQNAANPYPAMFAESVGSGPSIRAEKNSGGGEVFLANNNSAAGDGIFIEMTNAGNAGAGLRINHSGTGNAITANRPIQATSFIGDGSGLTGVVGSGIALPFIQTNTNAGNNATLFDLSTNAGVDTDFTNVAHFQNLNPNAFSNILKVTNEGTGATAQVNSKGDGTGFISDNSSATNPFAAIRGRSNGGLAIQGLNYSITDGFAGTFTNTAATNSYPAIQAATRGTGSGVRVIQDATSIGGGMDVFMQNPTGTAVGFSVDHDGLGSAANFNVNNAASTASALNANNTGSGYGIYGRNTGTGTAGYFRKDGSNINSAAVWGDNYGTNGRAGLFWNWDTSNPKPALEASSAGTGPSFFANKWVGDLAGGVIEAIQEEPTNPSETLASVTYGTGKAGRFSIFNGSNSEPALEANTNGTGSAIRAVSTGANWTTLYSGQNGTTDSHAGVFENSYAGNTFEVLRVNNNAGAGGLASLYNNGTGRGIYVELSNTSNHKRGIEVNHQGEQGEAAAFTNSNAANTSAAISASTNGTGSAINATSSGDNWSTLYAGNQATADGHAAYFEITDGANNAAALQVHTIGGGAAGNFSSTGNASVLYASTTGNGVAIHGVTNGGGAAGNFGINNASSTSSSLYVSTTGTGRAIHANHTGASGDIAIFQSASANVARIDKTGQGFFNGGTVASGADVAEMFDVEGARESYEPGDVLVISEATDRTVEKSSSASSTKVVGVYATKPGVTLTEKGIDENLDQLVPMGVIGVIPTKVCLENGPIKRGDLLVTSSKTGHAMKAISVNGDGIFPSGIIIGKALENFDGTGKALINVLVNVK